MQQSGRAENKGNNALRAGMIRMPGKKNGRKTISLRIENSLSTAGLLVILIIGQETNDARTI